MLLSARSFEFDKKDKKDKDDKDDSGDEDGKLFAILGHFEVREIIC
jgi:hypothetical protein